MFCRLYVHNGSSLFCRLYVHNRSSLIRCLYVNHRRSLIRRLYVHNRRSLICRLYVKHRRRGLRRHYVDNGCRLWRRNHVENRRFLFGNGNINHRLPIESFDIFFIICFRFFRPLQSENVIHKKHHACNHCDNKISRFSKARGKRYKRRCKRRTAKNCRENSENANPRRIRPFNAVFSAAYRMYNQSSNRNHRQTIQGEYRFICNRLHTACKYRHKRIGQITVIYEIISDCNNRQKL